ncbi:helix-turn-helix transcriptional regulator [Amycolatopsis regifaucium]|uniref:Helix-turn-helix transcriptional regulator n=1 Tax=Amycolatopsis regifaucium TaxID=546365 RepID=A0A154MEQ0_9PSEU|nr:LuxR C-terminal-related transcriptional regulator [Amycolatopsis regifaucium]KZB82975.1 helix-turn-helix transcriptional regulator [Amycolatopsis regifaucium]OKA11352.1 helix-turn-helix transcriptional regulator [Amycolatopsis regifaucium]
MSTIMTTTARASVRAEERREIRVAVHAADPLVRAGLRSALGSGPGITLREDPETADVLVAVAGTEPHRIPAGAARLVLVADQPKQADLWAAVERGLAVVVARAEATPARLQRAVADAHAGRGDLPADQLGSLLRGISRLHKEVLEPRDITLSGLSPRETEVLRLLADGYDTGEIAKRVAYSDRTVKNILHGMLSRFGLRNRTHVVAYALREGLI